jgi:hypothetical protein
LDEGLSLPLQRGEIAQLNRRTGGTASHPGSGSRYAPFNRAAVGRCPTSPHEVVLDGVLYELCGGFQTHFLQYPGAVGADGLDA